MVEKGRHQKLPRNLRIWPLRRSGVEDEIHVYIECSAFHHIENFSSQKFVKK